MRWINGGSHVCIMLYGDNYGRITFLHSVIWGGLRVDYIFELSEWLIHPNLPQFMRRVCIRNDTLGQIYV